ncbi:MAG: hypothetical protein CNLJKLNK_00237 [Holosporales bacterium]
MINTKQAACLAWIAVIGSSGNLIASDAAATARSTTPDRNTTMDAASPEFEAVKFPSLEFRLMTDEKKKSIAQAVAELKKQYENSRNFYRLRRSVISDLRNDIKRKDDSIEILKELNSQVNSKILALEAELKAAGEANSVLRDERTSLTEQLKAKDLVIAEKNERITELNESKTVLSDFRSEIAQIRESIARASVARQSLPLPRDPLSEAAALTSNRATPVSILSGTATPVASSRSGASVKFNETDVAGHEGGQAKKDKKHASKEVPNYDADF